MMSDTVNNLNKSFVIEEDIDNKVNRGASISATSENSYHTNFAKYPLMTNNFFVMLMKHPSW